MMKRDFSVSAGVDQSLGVDDGAMAKVKYQTLVGEFLELQKDFVSRKRKLHAAKQKRDTILAEVRFLRRRRDDLLQNEAFNTEKDPVHLSNSDLKSKALKGELSFDGPEAMPENSNRFPLSDSHNGDTDQGVRDNEVLDLKPMDGTIHPKTAAPAKLCTFTR
ncbi:uncharacterized protein LOC142545223 isoform X2 [Primulina tabacum]|uniref:uncharacterized protein LOC142545223 isoform X2 n=1 Tax=Primulina tabacum TaxID=48773 RepID=UPI003F59C98D